MVMLLHYMCSSHEMLTQPTHLCKGFYPNASPWSQSELCGRHAPHTAQTSSKGQHSPLLTACKSWLHWYVYTFDTQVLVQLAPATSSVQALTVWLAAYSYHKCHSTHLSHTNGKPGTRQRKLTHHMWQLRHCTHCSPLHCSRLCTDTPLAGCSSHQLHLQELRMNVQVGDAIASAVSYIGGW